jgi:hypothetical protein
VTSHPSQSSLSGSGIGASAAPSLGGPTFLHILPLASADPPSRHPHDSAAPDRTRGPRSGTARRGSRGTAMLSCAAVMYTVEMLLYLWVRCGGVVCSVCGTMITSVCVGSVPHVRWCDVVRCVRRQINEKRKCRQRSHTAHWSTLCTTAAPKFTLATSCAFTLGSHPRGRAQWVPMTSPSLEAPPFCQRPQVKSLCHE